MFYFGGKAPLASVDDYEKVLAELDAKIAAESDPKKKAKLEAEKATKEQWHNAIK